jgi:hypothetical protein
MNILNWFAERAGYLIRWPVNLVRDFPMRIYRLMQTFWRLILGIIFFLPELLDAVRHDETQQWVRYKIGRMFDWLHRLAWQLFDLIGGPEIGQFFFHFFNNTTPLTTEEIDMVSQIIGSDAIRFHETRVAQGGLLNIIFKLNGNLAFATWRTINIPQTGRHTRENLPLIAHELTHVYQYEVIGSRYLGEAIYMLIKTKRDCYNYGGKNGLALACSAGGHYCDFNREQQAMIVQDYCILQQNGAEVDVYQPFIDELQQGLF